MFRIEPRWVIDVYQDRRRGVVPATAVFCCALDLEYDAVRSHVTGLQPDLVEHRGTLYELGSFAGAHANWKIVLTLAGRENTPAGIQVERAISRFEPQVLLFVGIAGGLLNMRIGDVVAASEVYDYESALETNTERRSRIKTPATSYRLQQRAHAVARSGRWVSWLDPRPAMAPKAVVKPIAAGAKVITGRSTASARLIAERCNDAAAVEMEGAGVGHGAFVNPDVDVMVIRGISDLLADKDKTRDAVTQPLAAAHAAAFAFELLHQFSPQAQPAPAASAREPVNRKTINTFNGAVTATNFTINN